MKPLERILYTACLEHSALIEFLKYVFSESRKINSSFTVSYFTKKAGLASRSFFVDVMAKRKRLGKETLEKLIYALTTDKDVQEYIETLFALENEKLQKRGEDSLQRIRNRIQVKMFETSQVEVPASMQAIREWRFVFAALGSRTKGSTFEEILVRAKVETTTCLDILQKMLAGGIVEFSSEKKRFYPKNLHFIQRSFDVTKDDSKNFFLHLVEKTKASAQKDFISETQLFTSSVVLVPKEKLKNIKIELRDILLRYIDTIESEDGDTLVSFLFSMTER